MSRRLSTDTCRRLRSLGVLRFLRFRESHNVLGQQPLDLGHRQTQPRGDVGIAPFVERALMTRASRGLETLKAEGALVTA